jgi:apolipoprotein D and lipocalin family protein
MRNIAVLLLGLMTGCVAIPAGITPVENFQVERYLGRWYEIARLDHSFERGLTRVTADYSRRDDGGIRVINRGWSATKGRWQAAEGRAYFVNGPEQGFLKVSFFGPFYGAYVIVDLHHEGYHYALVCGPDKSYLWILARTPQLEAGVQEALITRAAALGFATDKLITVDHD